MARFIVILSTLFLFAVHLSFASESIETFFIHDKASKALKELSHESFKFQLLASKIQVHPKYKKHKETAKFPKDFDLYIRITGVDINSIGNIDTESFYLAPAYNKLYVERYIEFLEYKINELELELAKATGKPSNEISKIGADLTKKETKLKGYISGSDQWPD